MLSAETIKEHDVRQNAGAQRLLKAGWKKRIVIQLSSCKGETRNFEEKRQPGIRGSHMMNFGMVFCFFCAGLVKLVFAWLVVIPSSEQSMFLVDLETKQVSSQECSKKIPLVVC